MVTARETGGNSSDSESDTKFVNDETNGIPPLVQKLERHGAVLPVEQLVGEQDEEDNEEERRHDPSDKCYCTFAVTGAIPTFQAIFVCRDCCKDSDEPLCICQGCADRCHDDHDDVEYLGMGPCYCDCDQVGDCTIFSESLKLAEEMGIASEHVELSKHLEDVVADKQRQSQEESSDNDQKKEARKAWIQDAYTIPALLQPIPPLEEQNESAVSYGFQTLSDILIEQAHQLVEHSKETHWVAPFDSTNAAENSSLCLLERLANEIFQRHVQHYNLHPSKHAGAEWWVQIKDQTADDAAIDLHYDKDEALAELFGLGSFPTLSTVTYLTGSTNQAVPTIVFPHIYVQGQEEIMDTMLISRPVKAKHLVFDGHLLHGAPAHELLRPHHFGDDNDESSNDSKKDEASTDRVTFLVNLWMDRKPAKVHPLDSTIQQLLRQRQHPVTTADSTTSILWSSTRLDMTPRTIHSSTLSTEQDLPKKLRQRIELPFVCKGITWDDDDLDDDHGLVVITFPPPSVKSVEEPDTHLITFGPSMQAYIDYKQQHSGESPTTLCGDTLEQQLSSNHAYSESYA